MGASTELEMRHILTHGYDNQGSRANTSTGRVTRKRMQKLEAYR